MCILMYQNNVAVVALNCCVKVVLAAVWSFAKILCKLDKLIVGSQWYLFVQAVCHIMKQIPVDCFCGLVSWICKLAKTSQVG